MKWLALRGVVFDGASPFAGPALTGLAEQLAARGIETRILEAGAAPALAGCSAAETVFVTTEAARADEAARLGCLPVVVGAREWPAHAVGLDRLADLLPLFDRRPDGGLERLLRTDDFEALRAALLEPHLDALAGMKQVYLFGAQMLGAKVAGLMQAAGIEVLGLLDNDPAKHGQRLAGLPICSVDELAGREGIPVVISSAYVTEIHAQLRARGCREILLYPHLTLWNAEAFPDAVEEHYIGHQADLVANRMRHLSLFLNAADDASRATLDDVWKFRLTLDPRTLDYGLAGEYFEPELHTFGSDEVFVDGGGYTGDTAQRFIDHVGGRYRRVYVYEPDASLLAEARKRLAGREGVVFRQQGLYAEPGVVRFSAAGGLTGAIIPDGGIAIDVVSLDSTREEPVSFLKLDIEGAEAPALQGARRTLAEDAPKLAIAVYHKAHDLWSLPALVRSLNPRYRYYMRHYGRMSFGTIGYFVT